MDIFAEIDIEPIQKSGAAASAANAAIPIIPRTPDPVREKFCEMRRLATLRPYPRNDSELFCRQARFMEDFEDNFGGNAAFNMYFPYYQRMGYDYLRTYFTWRTRVRKGDIRETSLSYIFLYIYELLSGIGVKDPAEGFGKLMNIWDAFAKTHNALEVNLVKWFKDYHVFYGVPQDFRRFIEEHNLQKYYVLSLLPFVTAHHVTCPGRGLSSPARGAGGQHEKQPEQAEQLLLFNSLSGYDVTKSRFYNDGNEELLSKCFDAVVIAIQEFCKKKGAGFEDMLIYSVTSRRPWKPFQNALFDSRYKQADREVHISKYERYYCKNGAWTANLPVYYSSQKDFIGYLIKKTEACLRAAAGYKYKLAAEMRPGAKPFRELQRPAAKRAELDIVIERAVEAFCAEITRVKVVVDHSSLARIREEALETQESLIVEEVTDEIAPHCCQKRSMDAEQSQTEKAPPLTLSFGDGWKELKKRLTDTEREALLLIHNGSDVKSFALGKNIMLEVLLGGINEKASVCIGDSLLEFAGETYIFDEYRTNVAEIISNNS